MTPLIFYAFFVLIQGGGLESEAFGNLEDCNTGRIERARDKTSLALSPCAEVTIRPEQQASL